MEFYDIFLTSLDNNLFQIELFHELIFCDGIY